MSDGQLIMPVNDVGKRLSGLGEIRRIHCGNGADFPRQRRQVVGENEQKKKPQLQSCAIIHHF